MQFTEDYSLIRIAEKVTIKPAHPQKEVKINFFQEPPTPTHNPVMTKPNREGPYTRQQTTQQRTHTQPRTQSQPQQETQQSDPNNPNNPNPQSTLQGTTQPNRQPAQSQNRAQ
jgi:hypothetical protein